MKEREFDESRIRNAQRHARELQRDPRRVYEKSIHNRNRTVEISGETYVGNNSILVNWLPKAVAVALVIGAVIVGSKAHTLNEFKDEVNIKAENQLSDEELEKFQAAKETSIFKAFDNLEAIKEAKEELKETGNYDFAGNNIVGESYEVKDPDAMFISRDLEIDAIEQAAQDLVSEYNTEGMSR